MRQVLRDLGRVELGHLRRVLLLVSATALASLVVTGLIWVEWPPLQQLDDAVVTAAVSWTTDHPAIQDPLNRIGVSSGKRNLWPLSALLAGLLWLAGRHYAGSLVALSVASTTVVTGVIKRVLTRERPEWYVPEDPLVTSSFPSGHVALLASLVVALVIALPMVHRRLRGPGALLALAPLFALLAVVSVQRVLQGRHFPSDVVVGGLIGVGCALASWALIELYLDVRRVRAAGQAARVTTA